LTRKASTLSMTHEADAVLLALRRAVAEAIQSHWRMGRPVSAWKNGRVVWIYPDGHEELVPPGPRPRQGRNGRGQRQLP